MTNRVIVWFMLTIFINVGRSPSKRNCFIYFNESPFKMMKNAFHFILKALKSSFWKLFLCFLFWLFGQIGKTAKVER